MSSGIITLNKKNKKRQERNLVAAQLLYIAFHYRQSKNSEQQATCICDASRRYKKHTHHTMTQDSTDSNPNMFIQMIYT